MGLMLGGGSFIADGCYYYYYYDLLSNPVGGLQLEGLTGWVVGGVDDAFIMG